MILDKDPSGRIVPAGRITRTLRTDLIDGVLPSWLAVQAGTGSSAPPTGSNSPAYFQVATAATAGAGARLWGPEIWAAQYDEIIFTVLGLRFDLDAGWAVRMEIGGTSQDRGVALRQDNLAVSAVLRAHNGAAFVDTATSYPLQKADGAARKPRNVTLRWRPKRGHVWVMEDDQVMARADVGTSALTAAPVRPMITFSTVEAVAHNFKLCAVEVQLVHN